MNVNEKLEHVNNTVLKVFQVLDLSNQSDRIIQARWAFCREAIVASGVTVSEFKNSSVKTFNRLNKAG